MWFILPYKNISTEDGYHGHLYTSVGQYNHILSYATI